MHGSNTKRNEPNSPYVSKNFKHQNPSYQSLYVEHWAPHVNVRVVNRQSSLSSCELKFANATTNRKSGKAGEREIAVFDFYPSSSDHHPFHIIITTTITVINMCGSLHEMAKKRTKRVWGKKLKTLPYTHIYNTVYIRLYTHYLQIYNSHSQFPYRCIILAMVYCR